MPHLTPLEITSLRPTFSLAFRRLIALDPDQVRQSELEELWFNAGQKGGEGEGMVRRRAEMGEFERGEREGTAMEEY